jgi:LysM repeat protein
MHRTRTSLPTHELRSATALFALGGGCALVLWWVRPRQALLPPLRHAGGLAAWLDHHDPVLTVVALARGVGLVLAAYLLVTSGLALVAGLTRSRALSRLARAVTVPALRRLLPATLGVGLVLATTAAASPGATAGSPSPGSTGRAPTPTTTTTAVPSTRADLLTRLPDRSPDGSPTTERAPTPTPSPRPPQRPRSDDIARFHLDAPPPAPSPTATTAAPRPTTTPAPQSPTARRGATAPPRPPSVPPTNDTPTWTVRSGDHLWGIASATLSQRLARTPTDAEIEPYWRRLIDLNRSRLVDPGNPDLIFPTQVFDLPR